MNVDTSQVTEPDHEDLQAKISRSSSVFIQSIDHDVPLNQPVYAINWFNTRLQWLYDFYNLLGASAVNKVDGKPFLKGRVKNILYGSEQFRRDVLLIVNYPGANAFKQMLESTYFQFVSLLRLIAVKDFNFGFSRQTGAAKNRTPARQNKVYAIHHYRGETDIAENISNVTAEMGVEIYFSARMTSLLFMGDHSRAKVQVPCMMDGVVVLQADTDQQLADTIALDDYKTVIQQTQSSFIATLERIF